MMNYYYTHTHPRRSTWQNCKYIDNIERFTHVFSSCSVTEQEFASAIELYNQAIELDPTKAVLFGNRSFAHLRLENFGYALEDANRAIQIDSNYVKGYYRRALAYMSLGKFKLALKDLEAVSDISSSTFIDSSCYY